MPGFRSWLGTRWEGARLFVDDEAVAIRALDCSPYAALRAAFETVVEGEWWHDPARSKALRAWLLRLAAIYLIRDASSDEKIGPVARFHLGNGARLERINWLGNTASRGMREPFGIMVNYLYDPGSIEADHEKSANTGHVVRSPDVDMLATPRKSGMIAAKAA